VEGVKVPKDPLPRMQTPHGIPPIYTRDRSTKHNADETRAIIRKHWD
jgi:hypothetical protein